MSQLLVSEVRYQQRSEQKEWLLFVDQLEAELNRAQFEKVENDRLYLKQEGKPISMGKSKSNDFRKTDASGRGYQPMVLGKSTYRNDEKFFTTTIDTGKNQFEFHFSPLKKTGQKSEKTENKTKEGNEEKKEEGVKKETVRSSKLASSKNGTE